ncbi:mannose-1-phosphate guanylyltransferase [Thermohalobacter berrensis]|uniref:mannose-1-phosphate guanylyltransferase n=2 Tax=Thermohalobacter berrensis TaxID=99594 RepID=A0A419T4B6_9FIRM|nr:mannose-1-phosphate guanylyltransferase [Thermohalobacter berrensis]
MISAVIMAGGKGERFWPKSRKKQPKQLLKLTNDDKTMIQLTVDRIEKLVDSNNIFIATVEDYAHPINSQLPQVPKQNILVEPMGKNTAACIGLAAVHIAKKDPDAVMLVLPSDHLIKNNEKFIDVLKTAKEVAEQGENLVTIGIRPQYPETGYGYINFEEKIDSINGNDVLKVNRFVEKPDKETAKKYLESGKYLWNSGMFAWKVSTILKCMEMYMPELYKGLMKIKEAIGTDKEEEVLCSEYSKFESISIDYGIMEKAESIFVIPGDFGWDDVGSWTSLERINNPDKEGNVVKGDNVITLDTKKCIIEGSNKLIATIGVEDLVIVDTDDATLICSKEKSQQVKNLLKKIKIMKKENYL